MYIAIVIIAGLLFGVLPVWLNARRKKKERMLQQAQLNELKSLKDEVKKLKG